MTRLKSIAFVLALTAAPALAQEVAVGDPLGAEAGAISAALAERGYEVRKTEAEDGKIEVYAVREGRRFEIYVDAKSGAVTRIKEKF